MTTTSVTNTEQYNYDVIRKFAIMTLVWGVVGMFVGLYIASELAFPVLNFDNPYITFGRLRPVHTGAVIFGFGGSALCLDARDLHISIAGLVSASQPLMEMAATLIAARNGSKTSNVKARTARQNGKSGGRPRILRADPAGV